MRLHPSAFGSGSFGPSLLFFDSDDGGSGGGSDDSTISLDEHKKLLKEAEDRFNANAAKQRRSAEASELKLKQQLEELQTQLTEIQDKHSGSGGKDGDAGRIEMLEKKHRDQIAALEKRLNDEAAARQEEQKRRLQVERDKMLSEALNGQCLDQTGGVRYFMPQIEYDDDSQAWMFRTKNGNLVSIAEGVAAEMPDWLKPASVRGGSGSGNGSPKLAERKTAVDAAEKALKEAQAAVSMDRGSVRSMKSYRDAKAQLDKAKRELAEASKR